MGQLLKAGARLAEGLCAGRGLPSLHRGNRKGASGDIDTNKQPPEVAAPCARRSLRLANEQRQLGLQAGGEMAARIATRQGMPISPATILRLARRTQLAEHATPSLLGVDKWTYRKRLDFKTILVDLSTNRPLELLPYASATTLASWLQAHLGVRIDCAALRGEAP